MIPPELLTTRDIRAVHFAALNNEPNGGQRWSSGLVRLDPEALVIEGNISYPKSPTWAPAVAEFFGAKPKFRGDYSISIPYSDLDRIELLAGWFWTPQQTGIFRQALVLSVKRLSLLKPLNEADKGTLRLPFSKHDLPAAKALVSRAALLVQHHRLDV